MKIAIVNLTSGGMSGGYRKYLESLVPLLRRDSRVERLDVFMPPGLQLPCGGPVRSWPSRDGLRGYRGLRRELRQLAPDVVFFPTARWIDCGGVPTVVMIRNMEPLAVPFGGNTWLESLRNLARARAARAACVRATRVIAVSHHVRRFITETWRLPADRVGVVYHGIEPANDARSQAAPAALGDLRRFVFTAGSIRPARGLEDLIRAAPALIGADPALRMAIAGRADAAGLPYEVRMRGLAERLGVAHAVLWAGHLAAPEMAWASERCAAFVVTSRAEACPNIALEAMSHGAPIVSTTQEPMPEFFDDVATYYSPGDAAALAARVADALALTDGDKSRRRDAARVRASTFTWPRTAEETVEQLRIAALVPSGA